ncbi:MAG: FHA domain-containing protein [Acidobacteria bacterium]|nr:FHA domain-containing protein [Acidobacteriota bacterium]MBK8313725.1 FHA domain-containing protein [Acidobacteriota bacterium]MBK9706536.1 FHA domain-containing protein [Acidobacteriota bacterium]
MIGQKNDLTIPQDAGVAGNFGRGRETVSMPVPRVSLVFTGGLCSGRTGYVITKETTSIGRDESCDIILDGDTVSRVHCIISRYGNIYVLKDSSRNGTWVNGERVNREIQLREGDEIRTGRNFILVKISSGINTSNLECKSTLPQSSPLFLEMGPQIVIKGIEEGVTQPLSENKVIIGRKMDNQLVLDDENISRQHSMIERIDGKYFVHDMGSANGTIINDRRIEADQPPVELNEGDRLKIGKFLITVNLPGKDCVLNFKKSSRW